MLDISRIGSVQSVQVKHSFCHSGGTLHSDLTNCHMSCSTCCYINHVIKHALESRSLPSLPVRTVALKCKTGPHTSRVDSSFHNILNATTCGDIARSVCILMDWKTDFCEYVSWKVY